MTKMPQINFEKYLFRLAGVVMIYFVFVRATNLDAMNAGIFTLTAIGLFVYSNISQFKRIKGFGFEAELWDSKQEEAEELVKKLQKVIYIYTHEVIIGRIMRGRLTNGTSWEETEKLFVELTRDQKEFGSQIDFSKLEKEMTDLLLFDTLCAIQPKIRNKCLDARQKIEKSIHDRYPAGERKGQAYHDDFKLLNSLDVHRVKIFYCIQEGRGADALINFADEAKAFFKNNFDYNLEFSDDIIDDLKIIRRLEGRSDERTREDFRSYFNKSKDVEPRF